MLAARYVEREASPASDASIRSARIGGEAKSVKKQTLGSYELTEANRVSNGLNARHEIAFGNYEVATVGIGDCCRPGQWQIPTRFTLSKPVIPRGNFCRVAGGSGVTESRPAKLRRAKRGHPQEKLLECNAENLNERARRSCSEVGRSTSIPRSGWISPRKKFPLVTSTMVCVLTLPH